MRAALATELIKLVRATVARAATVATVFGIALICASMLLAADTDDPQLAAKLGPLVGPGGWAGYLAAAAQVTAAAGFLGSGVVLSWMFGREFTDGTVTGLFALPVTRATIAAAKLVLYVGWALIAGAGLVAALVALGYVFGLGPIPTEALPALGRQYALFVLTAAAVVPAALAATLGRSVLAGIGTAIGILVLSQIAVLTGAGSWFPFSAPALWAVSGGANASPFQLALVTPVVVLTGCLILASWRRLQLHR